MVYVMVTFLIVDRALVTFTATETISLDVGDVGLMIGVPITGGCDGGGACAIATEPTTKARAKRSIGRLRLVIASITIIVEGALDFGAVTIKPWNAEIFNQGTRCTPRKDAEIIPIGNLQEEYGHDWSLGRALNPRPCGAESCPSAYEADAVCCKTHLPG